MAPKIIFRLAAILIAIAGLTSIAHAQTGSPRAEHEVGLRDGFGLGFSVGTTTGFWADFHVPIGLYTAAGLEASYGAGLASWGLGQAFTFGVHLDFNISDDHAYNAFVLSPSVGYGLIVGDSSNWGWGSFAPCTDVGSVYAICAITWIHEFRSGASFELSLRPGLAIAVSGQSNRYFPESGNKSPQVTLAAGVRF